jgi:hypothetical protein
MDINASPQKQIGEYTMKYISLVFEDDLQPEDIDTLKTVRGCLGVSAYKNTVNLYFKRLDTVALTSLALVLRKQISATHIPVSLGSETFSEETSTAGIYTALRGEAIV